MANTSYKYYSELMAKVYPAQWKTFLSSGTQTIVWIDNTKSWGKLDPFIKEQVIERLELDATTGKPQFIEHGIRNRLPVRRYAQVESTKSKKMTISTS